jgi:hypothetical protein
MAIGHPGHPSSAAKNIPELEVTVSSTLKWLAEVCKMY